MIEGERKRVVKIIIKEKEIKKNRELYQIKCESARKRNKKGDSLLIVIQSVFKVFELSLIGHGDSSVACG